MPTSGGSRELLRGRRIGTRLDDDPGERGQPAPVGAGAEDAPLLAVLLADEQPLLDEDLERPGHRARGEAEAPGPGLPLVRAISSPPSCSPWRSTSSSTTQVVGPSERRRSDDAGPTTRRTTKGSGGAIAAAFGPPVLAFLTVEGDEMLEGVAGNSERASEDDDGQALPAVGFPEAPGQLVGRSPPDAEVAGGLLDGEHVRQGGEHGLRELCATTFDGAGGAHLGTTPATAPSLHLAHGVVLTIALGHDQAAR